LKLVSDQAELSSYVVKGSVERPPAWNLITNSGDVILQSGQRITLLFKYLTKRETTF